MEEIPSTEKANATIGWILVGLGANVIVADMILASLEVTFHPEDG